jgi:hypothetical protein
MEQQAAALYERLKPLPGDDQKLAECYRLLFAREPTEQEVNLAQQFVTSGAEATESDREARWKDYLQALLGLNEFHFVD